MQKLNNHSAISYEEVVEIAEMTRDLTHNLDLTDPKDQELFDLYSRNMLIALEGYYTSAYDDRQAGDPYKNSNLVKNILAAGGKIEGNVTVGVGFNMDAGGAKGGREQWDKALRDVSFDDVYNGKRDLTRDEVDRLSDYSENVRIIKLQKHYGEAWGNLRPNEQLGILLPFFNCEALVKSGTYFHGHMTDYASTGDPKSLESAIKQLTHHSNKDKLPGLDKRRKIEAILLDSRKSPFYVIGTNRNFPTTLKTVYAGKTRIPRGMPLATTNKFKDFYVWRCQMDDKVRPEHLKREGLIYRKDGAILPGLDYNCRCWAEEVPAVENVILLKWVYIPLQYSRPIAVW